LKSKFTKETKITKEWGQERSFAAQPLESAERCALKNRVLLSLVDLVTLVFEPCVGAPRRMLQD